MGNLPKGRLAAIVVLLQLLLASCLGGPPVGGEPLNQETIAAYAAATLQAAEAEGLILSTSTPTAFIPPTSTPRTPVFTETPTDTPTATSTPLPTATPIPSATPVPSITPNLTATAAGSSGGGGGSSPPVASQPCLAARFLGDVTIPDYTVLNTGERFTKIWRVSNAGTCDWEKNFTLALISGDALQGDTITIGEAVEPGDDIDLRVNLVSPNRAGSYAGYWMLHTPSGARFGVGSGAAEALNVKIESRELNNKYVYDLAINACAARWSNGEDDLVCPGSSNSKSGFVIPLSNPELETGPASRPAIWTSPEQVRDGIIEGVYPSFRVQQGDRLRMDLGCLDDSKDCNVRFLLSIDADGQKLNYGPWVEVSDKDLNGIDIDLTPFAGKSVRFILHVSANGAYDDDNAVWYAPHVERNQ